MRNDIPLSNGQAKALVLIVAVIASAIAAPMLMLPDSPQPTGENGEVATATPTPAKGTVQEFSGEQMNPVPDSHAKPANGIPAPTVTTSDGSQTMQVRVTEVDGDLALTFEDDQVHKGRWVGIPTAWFEAHFDEVPEMTTVRHESGDIYHEPTEVEDGTVRFYIAEFSENTVTFDSEVNVSMTGASNGSSASWEINDLDEASDPNVTLTGRAGTEHEVDTGQLDDGESTSVSIAGDLEPRGESETEPQLTVTGAVETYRDTSTGKFYDTTNNELDGLEFVLDAPGDSIQEVTFEHIDPRTYADGYVCYDVYINNDGTADGDLQEGTKVVSDYQAFAGTHSHSVNYDTSDTDTVTVELVENECSDSALYGYMDGDYTEVKGEQPKNIQVSIAGESKSYDTLSDGESATKSVDLPAGDSDLSVTMDGGKVDWELSYVERQSTNTASVTFNGDDGQEVATDQNLQPGESVNLTGDSTWLAEGTNNISVQAGNGSASADAPTPVVDVRMTHEVTDTQTVNYTATTYTESYNVSKTFASDRENASLTIPFDGRVVGIDNIDYRINQSGGWDDVPESAYSLDDTTLTVDLAEANGGTIEGGSTVEVRAKGLKLNVKNGSVTVTDTTDEGQRLQTTFEVDSADEDFRIGVGTTRVHYLDNTSWTAGEYFIADQQGQRLHMPNASAGDTATLRTLPVEVDVKSGAAQFEVPEPNTTEPELDVSPAGKSGQSVDYTFVEAQDGTKYILYSQTNNVVRDSGTAESPLTLSDDDSEETLQFLVDDGSSGGSSGGDSSGGGGGIVAAPSSDDFTDNLIPLSLVALAAAGLIVVSRNDDEVAQAGGRTAQGIEGTLSGIPIVGPALGQATAGLVRSAAQLVRAVLNNQTVVLSLLGAIALAAIQSGILQVPDSTMPLLVLIAVAAGSWIALRDTGNWDIRLWIGLVGAATVVTVVAISDADPVTAVTESRVFPILGLGGLYLGYRALGTIRDALGGDDGDGGGDGVTIQADTVVRNDGGDD